MNKNDRKILIKAAEIVDKGWCQGTTEDDRGNHCMLGAIWVADTRTVDSWKEPARKVQEYISNLTGFRSITFFNDEPSRTKEEVIQVLLEVVHND